MKRLILTTALIFAAGAASADKVPYQPHQGVTMPEYVTARGCTIIDMGGYTNVQGPDGGGCAALQAFNFGSTRLDAGADDVIGTADDAWVSDN